MATAENLLNISWRIHMCFISVSVSVYGRIYARVSEWTESFGCLSLCLSYNHIRGDILFSYLLLFLCMYIIYHGAFPLTASYCENSRDRQPGATILYLFFLIPFFFISENRTLHGTHQARAHANMQGILSPLISCCDYYWCWWCCWSWCLHLVRLWFGSFLLTFTCFSLLTTGFFLHIYPTWLFSSLSLLLLFSYVHVKAWSFFLCLVLNRVIYGIPYV